MHLRSNVQKYAKTYKFEPARNQRTAKNTIVFKTQNLYVSLLRRKNKIQGRRPVSKN